MRATLTTSRPLRRHLGTVILACSAVAVLSAAAANFGTSATASHSVGATPCFYRSTVPSGSLTNTSNGTSSVTISSVDTAKAFLLFSTRHDSNRPVGSAVRGRIADATIATLGTAIEWVLP